MRRFSSPLNVPNSDNAAGTAHSLVDFHQNTWVQVTAPFTGTLDIEIALDDGLTFFPYVTGITAPGLFQIVPPALSIRIRRGVVSAGEPAAVVAGFYVDG